jgi:hypothetical protein
VIARRNGRATVDLPCRPSTQHPAGANEPHVDYLCGLLLAARRAGAGAGLVPQVSPMPAAALVLFYFRIPR